MSRNGAFRGGRIPHLELFHSPFRNIEPRRVVSAMLCFFFLGGGGVMSCSLCGRPLVLIAQFQFFWANVERFKNRLSHGHSNKVRADLHKHFPR